MTTAIYATAVVLGLAAFALLGAALVQLLRDRGDGAAGALRGYDERVAAVTEAIEQTLGSVHVADSFESPGTEAERAAEAVVAALERARAKTGAEAALVVVPDGTGAPSLTSVGLSHEEAAEVTRMGVPDYRGARAVDVAFLGDAADGEAPPRLRSGLCVPVLDAGSMLAVLTRSSRRRFSEADVDALHEVADVVRRALEPDPRYGSEPEPEMLADLLDRQSFYAACSREIADARAGSSALALLVVSVDREGDGGAPRTGPNDVLDEVAGRLQRLAGSPAFVCRLDGRRLGVLVRGSEHTAHDLLAQLREALARDPLLGATSVSASGGVAELLADDGPSTLLDRAETARRLATPWRAGTGVGTTPP